MSRYAMKISLSLSIMGVLLLGYTNCSSPKVDDSGSNPYSSMSDSEDNKLQIAPSAKTIGLGESLQLAVTGGTKPYRFSLSSGGGSIDPNTGVYVGASIDSDAVINVEDVTGKIGQAVIKVSVNSSSTMTLAYSPTGAVKINSQLTLTAAGGVAPYTYFMYSGVGSISGNVFYATSFGTAVIAVRDSAQKISTFTINVGSDVTIVTAPIYLLYNSSAKQYLYSKTTTEGTGSGYVLQSSSPTFKVLNGSYLASAALNRCYVTSNGGRYLTTATTCGSNTLEGSLGYVWTYSASNSVPLYNCFKSSTGTYLVSTDTATCINNGFNVQSTIGWAPL